MLYNVPSRRRHVLDWLKAMTFRRRPGAVTDLRELGSYLRADIGVTDANYPFRRRP